MPVLLRDVAKIRRGPTLRRGVAEPDGQGPVVGGIAVMRYGKNALETIQAVKARLAQLQKSLPPGMEIVTTCDRSRLIHSAVTDLGEKPAEEFLIVALICALFLWHLRSSLAALITLPLGLVGGLWLVWLLGYAVSVATVIGYIGLAGITCELGVVMMLYLRQARKRRIDADQSTHAGLDDTIREGACCACVPSRCQWR